MFYKFNFKHGLHLQIKKNHTVVEVSYLMIYYVRGSYLFVVNSLSFLSILDYFFDVVLRYVVVPPYQSIFHSLDNKKV